MTAGVVNVPGDFVVRVQINPTASPEVVERLLDKILRDLTVAFEVMNKEALRIMTAVDWSLIRPFVNATLSPDTPDSTEREQSHGQ